MSRLSGRVVVVTGASRGIGAAVAARFMEQGARVVRVARTLSPAESADLLDVACDLTLPDQVQRLAALTERTFGAPDIVVQSAGAFGLATLEHTSAAGFASQLSANLQAPFLVAKAFLPAMQRAGHGRLISIGSIADHRAFPENAAYAASKYGLRGLHEVLREEYRGRGVLCTLISPGPTDTSAWDAVDPDHREGFTPRARMLRPEDVAEAVLWVCGQPHHVDVDWLRLGPA